MKNCTGTISKHRIEMLIGILTVVILSPQIATAADNSKVIGGLSAQHISTSRTKLDKTTQDEILQTYAHLPFRFEPNAGQMGANVKFAARGAQYTLLFGPTEILIVLPAMGSSHAADENLSTAVSGHSEKRLSHIVRMRLVDSNPNSEIRGLDQLPGKINYFLGNAPKQWRTHIPVYAKVKYAGVYPGIDLVFYSNRGDLEFDFIVAPGVRPDIIKMAFEGVEKMQLDGPHDLLLFAADRKLKLHKPFIYQETENGRRQISGSYLLDDHHHVRLKIASYDARKPLVIDPRLHYATFLGGEGSDQAYDIALDGDGNVLVTGSTTSVDFPIKNSVRADLLGDQDVFVTKFNPTLSSIFYSSYLGGSGHERGYAIAVDRDGNAYITGLTRSINYPVTADALDATCGSDGFCNPAISDVSISQNSDAFVTKLDPSGNMVYSTYLGGGESDHGRGIAVDGVSSIYVTGATFSRDFPITSAAFQTECAGGNPLANYCSWETFVAKLNPTGTELMYSTFFGGSSRDEAYDITLEAPLGLVSAVYVAGITSSNDFPATAGANLSIGSNSNDGFVMKLNALGSDTIYAARLGGSEIEWINSIAVDDQGHAYVIGTTSSPDFPTTPGAFDQACGTDGNCDSTGLGYWVDAFVVKLNPTGTALVFSTYLGGINKEFGLGIAVHTLNGESQATVTGKTLSPDFPTLDPVQGSYGEVEHTGGSGDVFVTRFNSAGSGLVYSTYIGGAGPDGGWGITVDGDENAYITGNTTSNDFPATLGAFQSDLQNPVFVRGDAFVARIGKGLVMPPLDLFWQLVIYLAVVIMTGLIFYGWRKISFRFPARRP